MSKLQVLDLFSGIGGFSLGLERTGGFSTAAFCEIEEYPRKVLAKHWPKVKCYHDVTKLTGDILARDGIAVDVITGGFPCQDISVAGKQAGIGEDTRSGLWSDCLRLLSELRPKYAIFENVTNLLSGPTEQPGGWFSQVLCDLASIGYDAEWHCVPSCFVGGWSTRSRVWILAYPNNQHSKGGRAQPIFGQSDLSREPSRMAAQWPGRSYLPAPIFAGASSAIPHRVDRTKAVGNAVDPTIPEFIGHAILAAEACA